MKITIDISSILEGYELGQNETFCLYLMKNDGYNSFGYVGDYTGTATLAQLVSDSISDPSIYGVWVTVESGDGVKDIDVFKVMKGSV